jgi:CRP-like cAMP-binding protein
MFVGGAMPFKSNLLLDALGDLERHSLVPHLARRELKQRQILFDVREAVNKIYFPTDAVISLVIPLSTGEQVETAMVGRDGVIGDIPALNGLASVNRAVVKIAGQCFVCEIEPFKNAVAKHSNLQRLIAAHVQVLFAQAQQSAACNATHHIESRLARWLLRAADLRGGNELSLTQEDIAAILGVRRTSVTVVARTLQQAGMIKYARGHIRLLDIPALQETACECYQAIKSNYDALIQPDGNQAVLSPTLAPAGD